MSCKLERDLKKISDNAKDLNLRSLDDRYKKLVRKSDEVVALGMSLGKRVGFLSDAILALGVTYIEYGRMSPEIEAHSIEGTILNQIEMIRLHILRIEFLFKRDGIMALDSSVELLNRFITEASDE